MSSSPAVTELLGAVVAGDDGALAELLDVVYADLRRMGERQLRHEPGQNTLQPTALVHEAYLRLVDQQRTDWKNRAHFFAIAARMIRRVLVDHARARRAQKRDAGPGGAQPWSDSMIQVDAGTLDLLALDEALELLAAEDARAAQVVEMRFFAGQGEKEIAEVLGVTTRTVQRTWAYARATLFRTMAGRDRPQ